MDATAWGEVCDHLAGMVGGVGVGFVPLDVRSRTPGCPHSESLDEFAAAYLRDWAERDYRGDRGFPVILAKGIAADHDHSTPEQIRSCPFYNELLAPFGLRWSIALAFRAGGDVWAAVVQGRSRDEPFTEADKGRILQVRQQLSIAARRSAASGFDRVEDWRGALEAGGRAVLSLDETGRVRAVSPDAAALLTGALQVRAGRVTVREPSLQRRIGELIDAATRYDPFEPRPMPPPVVVPSAPGRSLHVDALPLPRDYQALLNHVVALVLLRETEDDAAARAEVLRQRFGLTPAELRLAMALADGTGLHEAAEDCGVRLSTARVHLKSIFAKTGARRQGQLVALLARLC